MADKVEEKKPRTMEELTQELDKDALSPEVVAVESVPDVPDAEQEEPPKPARSQEPQLVGPRERGPQSGTQLPPEPKVDISDDELKQAAQAADETEADTPDNTPATDKSLHLEANPNAPRKKFWQRKRFWATLIFLLIVAGAFAWLIRPSRLFIVNALGLRAELSIRTSTLPETGQQSSLLKNVTVAINGTQWKTSDQGTLPAKVPYGDLTIVASKPGYQETTHHVLADFDPFFYLLGGRQQDESNRKITLQLKAIGIPLKIQAKDWLTNGPVTAGAFSVGDVVARPNDDGLVALTIPATEAAKVKVKAVFGGAYIDKEFEVPLDGTQQTITFVPAGKEYFISKRSGTLAVYSSDLDGSNVAEVVPGSERETAAMNIAISPSGKYGVLASTRDNKRDAQGTLLQQLYIVDLANKKLTRIDEGQWFAFADWQGDTLVYTVGERTQGSGAVRQRLASIDTTSNRRSNLGTADFYHATRVAFGSVIYQVGTHAGNAGAQNSPELRVVPIKGGTEKNLGYKVQQLSQPDTERFAYQTSDGIWHEYNANTQQVRNVSAPASLDRAFLATATSDGQHRILIDKLDGKPVIIAKSVANGQETQIYTAAGIRGPIRVVGKVVVFRKDDGGQVADFAVPLHGGTPKKVTDATQPAPASDKPANYFAFY